MHFVVFVGVPAAANLCMNAHVSLCIIDLRARARFCSQESGEGEREVAERPRREICLTCAAAPQYGMAL